MKILLGMGADPNIQSYSEGSPFHLAIKEESRKNVLLYLKIYENLDLSLKDLYGNTPIHDIIFLNLKEAYK